MPLWNLARDRQQHRYCPCNARRSSLRYIFACFLLLCCVANASPDCLAQNSPASQQTYSLSGSVTNSSTGEAVPHALVRTNGIVQRNTFSDNEGHFQIDGMPQCQVTVTAQKPGFSNDSDTRGAWVEVGPNTASLNIKMVPQSAIYGKVIDGAGLPIEHMPIRLTARAVRDGRKRWEPRGMTETDEDGHYRFAGLMPGTYFIAAGPREGELQLVPESEKQKSGFPHLYYPGVPELSSASPIDLAPGQQAEADVSINAVPVYQVSGMVSGHMPDQGVGFQVLTPSGDEVSLPTNFNMETGVFVLENVPAGNYLLRAVSQSGLQPLRAETRISVSSNTDGVRLTLGPAVSIPISVRLDSRASSGGNPQRPPLSVHLVPADIASADVYATYEAQGGMTVHNADFGTYSVDLRAQPPWYVSAASYGQTNVLFDDISISPGQAYPLDVVLRDDSAAVSGTVKLSASTPVASIVVVPQPLSKRPAVVQSGISDSFTIGGLAPGEYMVFAFDRADGLDLTSQDTIDAYASQGAHVTLTPSQKSQVQLELIHARTSQ